MRKHILVIGGGLAGTSAAYWLTERGYKVTIVERQDRLGGRIHSHLVDGAAVEMGAGFITKGYSKLRAFLKENNLESRLYRHRSKTGFFRNGKVDMITPSALMGGKPLPFGTKIHALPLLIKTVIGWPKLNTHAFWKAAKYDDRSVSDMFPGRSSRNFLEYVLQPVLNGYFYWVPERTSKAMLLILCRAAFSGKTYKMEGGLQRIPEKAAEGSTVLLNHTVKKLQPKENGSYGITVEYKGAKQNLEADGIVCATTASVVSRIFPELSKKQKEFFKAVKYSSGALVAQTYSQELTRGNKTIAFPREEGVKLASVTFSSEPRATNTKLSTVKVYASGSIGKDLCDASDSLITKTLNEAMSPVRHTILVGDPKSKATHIRRWPEALPYFDVGHFKRLKAFNDGEIEDQDQPIVFAGDYIGGPFMEGAFTSGVYAAERLDARLKQLQVKNKENI